MTLEQDVRRELAAAVAHVRPRPDPLGRLYARRRRRWAGFTAGAVAALAGLTVGGAVVVADRPDRDPPRPVVTRAEWVQRLHDAPPRGSLAGDAAFVTALAARAGGAVLLAEDGPDHRVAVVRVGAELRFLVGPPGAAAGALAAAETLPAYRDDPFPRRYLDGVHIGLAPPGCTVDTAPGPEATAWRPAPGGSYVVRVEPFAAEWWRVTCDGVVRYEAPARGGLRSGPAGPVVADADGAEQALDGRLSDARDREAAVQAYEDFVTDVGDRARTTPTFVTYGIVLGEPAVVFAALAVGGGWWLRISGPTGPTVRMHCAQDPYADGVLCAERTPSGTTFVVGPPDFIRIRARAGDRVLAEGPLDGGTGVLTLDPKADVRGVVVEALDAQGDVVASGPLDDGPAPRDEVDRWDG